MFSVLENFKKKQKCSMRHIDPAFVRTSRKNSKTLLLNLKTLQEVSVPIRADMVRMQTEKEILSQVVQSSGIERSVKQDKASFDMKKGLAQQVSQAEGTISQEESQEFSPPKSFLETD